MNQNNQEKMMQRVHEITAFSPRQLENEQKTAQYIMDFLHAENIAFITEEYDVAIPVTREVALTVDGESVACEGSSIRSGSIVGKNHIFSALSYDIVPKNASINFNPHCASISLPVMYATPSIAVSHDSLRRVLAGKHVQGNVQVEHVMHRSVNILVGNMDRPEKICFTHYDSIKTGAIDNASGVSVIMEILQMQKQSFDDTLYVIAANEELSCDENIYWGNGYRDFEKKHGDIMLHAKRIVVIDGVGNGVAQNISDPELLILGFPIVRIDELRHKISFITGDFDHLMTVYHSDDDDGRGMTETYMKHAYELMCQELNIRIS